MLYNIVNFLSPKSAKAAMVEIGTTAAIVLNMQSMNSFMDGSPSGALIAWWAFTGICMVAGGLWFSMLQSKASKKFDEVEFLAQFGQTLTEPRPTAEKPLGNPRVVDVSSVDAQPTVAPESQSVSLTQPTNTIPTSPEQEHHVDQTPQIPRG